MALMAAVNQQLGKTGYRGETKAARWQETKDTEKYERR